VNDGKIYSSTGKLYDTSAATNVFSGRGSAIYVMDDAGGIYISNYQAVGKFHHSSLLAGKPVAAAGEISIKDGVIQSITMKSGHYRPGKKFLDQFLNELREQGADLSKANIGRGF
jgi:hypothetical protein